MREIEVAAGYQAGLVCMGTKKGKEEPWGEKKALNKPPQMYQTGSLEICVKSTKQTKCHLNTCQEKPPAQ